MKPKQSSKIDENNPSDDFESGLSRLQVVLQSIEKGNLSLSEGLALYEEGVKLVRTCEEKLQTAVKQVEVLSGEKLKVFENEA